MEDTLTKFERGVLENVEKHGCQVNHVFDADDGSEPAFSYSIGFPETLGQPEVIIFGLPSDLMHFMINETWRQCRDGLVLEDGLSIEGLLEGHRCVARAVLPEAIRRDWFASAMWHQSYRDGSAMTNAFQIVWPSAQSGLFPWDPGRPDEVFFAQRPLYSPDGTS